VTPRPLLVTLALALIAVQGVAAQSNGTSVRRKPFEAFSASAERLRDSLTSTLGKAASTPVTRTVRPLAPKPIAVAPAPVTALWKTASAQEESDARDSIVAAVRAQLGTRYVWGADTPTRGFDCSGLVKFVLSMFRLDMPRTARNQSLAGRAVEKDTARLRPGDLLTFGRGKTVTHIGIYVGNGKFVHASTGKKRVVEANIGGSSSWFVRHWLGARRLVAAAADSAS